MTKNELIQIVKSTLDESQQQAYLTVLERAYDIGFQDGMQRTIEIQEKVHEHFGRQFTLDPAADRQADGIAEAREVQDELRRGAE